MTTNPHPSEQRVAEVKRFPGSYMVFRLKKGKNLAHRMGGQPLPWHHHETLELAEAEAIRLNAEMPECTFVVMQMVSRVKRPETAFPALLSNKDQ